MQYTSVPPITCRGDHPECRPTRFPCSSPDLTVLPASFPPTKPGLQLNTPLHSFSNVPGTFMSHPIPSACKLPSFTWQTSTHLSRLSSNITSTAVFPGSPRRGILPPGLLARLLIYTISRTFPWSLCMCQFIYYTAVFESNAPLILPYSVCAWP